MPDLDRSPLLVIDNLVRTLLLAGALLLASLIVSNPTSWLMKGAIVAFLWGFMSFVLASQFLITIHMQEWSFKALLSDNARSLRLAIPFLFGITAYFAAAVLISFHFIFT